MGLSYLHYETDEIDQLYLKLTPVIKMIVATLELRMSSRNHFIFTGLVHCILLLILSTPFSDCT